MVTQETKIVEKDEKPVNQLVSLMAAKFKVSADFLTKCLKDTVFKQKEGVEITNAQLLMVLHVAHKYDLDPTVNQLYAYPSKQGVVPFVGVDGWSIMINRHPDFNGVEFIYSDDNPEKWVKMEGGAKGPAYIECRIYKKSCTQPVVVREYLSEVYRCIKTREGKFFPGPWQTHTSRPLRHKALIQCARVAFGITGIYDEDEAKDIIANEDPQPIDLSSETSKSLNERLNMRSSMPKIAESIEEIQAEEVEDILTPTIETPIEKEKSSVSQQTLEKIEQIRNKK